MGDISKYQKKNVAGSTISSLIELIIILGVILGIVFLFVSPNDVWYMLLIKFAMIILFARMVLMEFLLWISDYFKHLPRKRFLKKVLPLTDPIPSELLDFFIADIEYLLNTTTKIKKLDEEYGKNSKKNEKKLKLYEVGIQGLEFVLERLRTKNLTSEDVSFLNSYFGKEIGLAKDNS